MYGYKNQNPFVIVTNVHEMVSFVYCSLWLRHTSAYRTYECVFKSGRNGQPWFGVILALIKIIINKLDQKQIKAIVMAKKPHSVTHVSAHSVL